MTFSFLEIGSMLAEVVGQRWWDRGRWVGVTLPWVTAHG